MKKFITKNFTLYTLHFTLSALVLLLVGCKESGTNKVSATGSIYECLVVSSESVYEAVKPVMEADMPCMPQMEPYFKVMHVVPTQFDSYLLPTRNILIVDIDSFKYTTLKAKVSCDVWSHPQAVYRIQSPSREAFDTFWAENSEAVREWFINEEIRRQAYFYRASTNKQARQAINKATRCDVLLPDDYILIMDTTLSLSAEGGLSASKASGLSGSADLSASAVHLTWCCNNKGPMRRDFVIYSYPYTDKRTFSLDYLCQKRDEVLGQVVTASVPGSYMGTEYRIFPPQYKVLQAQRSDSIAVLPYTAEIRGLWKIYGGEAMGGPFVSHTILDEQQQQVVTAEVFLFAPGQKKRNALRQAETILYTLQLLP